MVQIHQETKGISALLIRFSQLYFQSGCFSYFSYFKRIFVHFCFKETDFRAGPENETCTVINPFYLREGTKNVTSQR
ncbi:hypothetical protein ACUXCC_000404 [Cytobacillus horneckiae]|uniref:Uncharacterized protein n=1 Tax=Cytobacillus horneckiae TaxID=549687 RepID=A0A2N0ZBH7_9BACI|nr:hypothetical protein CWS20_21440 [Cytobacillus horneckiae]